ncbi:cysteine desulfurase family protein [Aureliella helgolandensis]|uniref:cysteine desulfurase n=1 Tax=Aureliella helgolandensis TaxID=2527968 RepID=A0A518G7R2_9BACT|nr:cysteine desulfurase family protein [Aureliella helgolandensis]QDV24623.1 Cysteine desulfurase [Aureliella helgolandensis]
MPTQPIYLDNNASTRLDPAVLEAMLPFLTEQYGNSSSTSHVFGQIAEKAVSDARENVARLLNCRTQEIVFTSGATESNNLAILGAMRASPVGRKLIIAAAEHKAVIDPAERLSAEGYNVCVLPVDKHGCVSAEQVATELDETTILVSIMHGNNEVGSINPISEIAALCRVHNVLFHTDATQTVGKIPLDLSRLEVDMLSLSAHKMYGPKGIGALFIRKRFPKTSLEPLVFGGGHERKIRSGTLPVHQIVGLGAACSICSSNIVSEAKQISALRELLKQKIAERVPNIQFNGHSDNRLPGSLHVSIPGANAEAVMMKLRNQLAMSSGSACTMSSPEPSHVLKAIGLEASCLTTSLRFGIGRFNTESEVCTAADILSPAVEACRQLSGYLEKLKNPVQ